MIQFFLLGKVEIHKDERPVSGLEGHKEQELVGYLLIFHDLLFTREHIATLLWPDRSPAQAKKYLRQTLWRIQSKLSQANAPQNLSGDALNWLQVESEWLQVRSDASIWCDIYELERAAQEVQETPGELLPVDQARRLDEVQRLYRQDFLEGCYSDWCLFERERFRYLYLNLLHKLIRFCAFTQQYERGIQYGAMILRYDQAQELTHRWLMRLHYLAGARSSALRQFDHCVRELKKELNVNPSQRTIDLYEQIRNDTYNLYAEQAQPAPSNHRELFSHLLTRIQFMHECLTEIQHHLFEITSSSHLDRRSGIR